VAFSRLDLGEAASQCQGKIRLPASLAQGRSPNPRLFGKPPFTHEIVLLAHLGSAASRSRPSVSGTHRSPPGLDAGDERR
jgi:hypothetical protein